MLAVLERDNTKARFAALTGNESGRGEHPLWGGRLVGARDGLINRGSLRGTGSDPPALLQL